MALKTYDISLQDGTVLRMRLTSRALSAYLSKHGITGASPVVSVLSAVNDVEAQIALLTAALKCDPKNKIQDGAVLIDTVIDEGGAESDIRHMIGCLAAGCGLVKQDALEDVLEALEVDRTETLEKVISLLRREEDKPSDGDADSEGEENPT